ncbi:MAG: pirin family protein [Chitinophagaceae bacterium]
MTTRTIAHIESATNEKVGDFKIKNVLPTRNLKQVDPFLLIHHMSPFELKPGAETRLPPHPHAGFEVVTYLLDGEFFHRDSKGHNQIAKGGDVNWMTSGEGIIHSEGPSENILKNGGTVQLLQLWINLPADKKQLASTFRHYASETFPVVENEKAWLKVVIGNYEGKTSPVSTHTPVFLYHVKIKKGELITIPVKESYTAAIYIMQGKIKVLNKEPVAGELVDFTIDGNQLAFTAMEDAEVLVLGGEPIKEKVVSYGPFVMNSFEEIQQAIADYETGKMGVLEY